MAGRNSRREKAAGSDQSGFQGAGPGGHERAGLTSQHSDRAEGVSLGPMCKTPQMQGLRIRSSALGVGGYSPKAPGHRWLGDRVFRAGPTATSSYSNKKTALRPSGRHHSYIAVVTHRTWFPTFYSSSHP